jgi:hypothetical protein
MAAVLTAAMARNSDVRCLAPTHKAAKNNLKLRVPDAETSTIHSFVKRKAGGLPQPSSSLTETMVDLRLPRATSPKVVQGTNEWQICIAGMWGSTGPWAR